MIGTGLSSALVVVFALSASAADRPEMGRRVANEKTPSASALPVNALPVSVLLEKVAKSPLTRGEAGLLRAVADLIEKEENVAAAERRTVASTLPVSALAVGAEAVQPVAAIPAAYAVPAQQRKRLAFRLRHAPAAHVAKALEQFLNDEEKAEGKAQRVREPIPSTGRAVFVSEPVSNMLFVSATPQIVDEMAQLIAELDAPPPAVIIDVCIAELLPRSRGGQADGGAASSSENAPSMEKDGAAWLAWAKKQGRLEVLNRPQIMTLDNQPAIIKVGTTVPVGMPEPGAGGPARTTPIEKAEIGLTLSLTPRISPEGIVLLALNYERAWVVKRDGTVGPVIGKRTVQATVSAKDGQTIVVGGPVERATGGDRQTIIAVTPRIRTKD